MILLGFKFSNNDVYLTMGIYFKKPLFMKPNNRSENKLAAKKKEEEKIKQNHFIFYYYELINLVSSIFEGINFFCKIHCFKLKLS